MNPAGSGSVTLLEPFAMAGAPLCSSLALAKAGDNKRPQSADGPKLEGAPRLPYKKGASQLPMLGNRDR